MEVNEKVSHFVNKTMNGLFAMFVLKYVFVMLRWLQVY